MGIHVKNITHVDVYWQKTLLFDYESIKCSSMDMSKVLLEYTGFQMVWTDALLAFFTATKSSISTYWKELFGKLQRCTLTTLKALQSTTSTRRTLVVQLWPLWQVTNPTKLGKQKTNYKILPKLLQMWKNLQTPIQNHQSKRDPLKVHQKRADTKRIGN